jgi:hypothetical protein
MNVRNMTNGLMIKIFFFLYGIRIMCDMNRLTDKEFFELKYYKYKAKVQQTKIEITDELSMAVSEKQKEIQEMREIINRLKEELPNANNLRKTIIDSSLEKYQTLIGDSELDIEMIRENMTHYK